MKDPFHATTHMNEDLSVVSWEIIYFYIQFIACHVYFTTETTLFFYNKISFTFEIWNDTHLKPLSYVILVVVFVVVAFLICPLYWIKQTFGSRGIDNNKCVFTLLFNINFLIFFYYYCLLYFFYVIFLFVAIQCQYKCIH